MNFMKAPRGLSALGTLIAFFLILLLLGVLWVISGGPSRPISHSGPWLTPPPVPSVNLGNGSLTQGQSTGYGAPLPTTPSTANILDYFFNARGNAQGVGSTSGPASPYAPYVELSDTAANQTDPNQEYLTIYISSSAPKNFTVSGWTIESTVNALKLPLPGAASVLDVGSVNQESPVTASPGARIYVVTGRSPNGNSFRTNLCSGYLTQFQEYTPRLQSNCPSPENEALLNPQKTAGSPACIDFVNRLRSCEMYRGDIPNEVGSSCREFIQDNLTYASCVSRHRNDPDFYGAEWFLYMKRDQEVWNNTHERIILRDENGLVISQVTY